MACCSVAVKNEDDPFKPEYVFPQYMLQYLLEEKPEFVGIKYLSIKAGRVSERQYSTDPRTYTNYVFPTRSSKPNSEGFCDKLCKQFEISSNISGRELQIASDMVRKNGVLWTELENDELSLDPAKIYGTNGTEYPYGQSIFGRIEIITDTDGKQLSRLVNKPQVTIGSLSQEDIDEIINAESVALIPQDSIHVRTKSGMP